MSVIIEKTLQLNIARLCCHSFCRWWYFNWGGAGPPGLLPPLATRMTPEKVFKTGFTHKNKSEKTVKRHQTK